MSLSSCENATVLQDRKNAKCALALIGSICMQWMGVYRIVFQTNIPSFMQVWLCIAEIQRVLWRLFFSVVTDWKLEQRICVKFCFKSGYTATNMSKLLPEMFILLSIYRSFFDEVEIRIKSGQPEIHIQINVILSTYVTSPLLRCASEIRSHCFTCVFLVF